MSFSIGNASFKHVSKDVAGQKIPQQNQLVSIGLVKFKSSEESKHFIETL